MRFNKKKRRICNPGYAAFFPAPLLYTPCHPEEPVFLGDEGSHHGGGIPKLKQHSFEKIL
jgi:hypothetical protein